MSLKLACEGVRSEEVACCRSSPLTLESYIRGSNGEGNDISLTQYAQFLM